MTGKVTVVGINGHIGRVIAGAFADAGWEVTGFGRSNRHPDPRVRFISGDANFVADIRAAIAGADVVFNALNLRYDQWTNGRKEAQMARVVEAVSGSGATLMFPGCIYNYSASERYVTPATPQVPDVERGAIQVRAEGLMIEVARRGDLQALILRAGDFYGPECDKDWFDQAMLREKGKLALMGKPGVGHSWAYLPDLARAAVALAERRKTLGAYELFHFAGHYVTPEQMGTAIVAASPVPLRVGYLPWLMLQVMGIVDPVVRDVARMRYLWENPMELTDKRLDAILGPDFNTPFANAVAATVKARFFPETKAAA